VSVSAARASSDAQLARPDLSPAARADQRQLIRNAPLDVTVSTDDDIAITLEQAAEITVARDGYVASEGPGHMVLRIPDERFDDALDQLGALGRDARREIRANDVTAAFTDLQIRLDSARALQARLRALLDDAETVADVLAVETELSRVTTQVDQLEGQMRLLQNQISFSTVRLSIRNDVKPGPVGWVFYGLYHATRWLFVWQ